MKKVLILCAVLVLGGCYYGDIDPNYYHRRTYVHEVHHNRMHFYRPEDHRLKKQKKVKPAKPHVEPRLEHHRNPTHGVKGGPAIERPAPKRKH